MDDFASASMLRLLLRAMAAEGLPTPLPSPEGARVPLAHKRWVVARIVAAGGLPLLMRLAQQVQHIAGEPLHRALRHARDPHDLLVRWQRLERYVHARHRVQRCGGGADWLELAHTSRDAQPPGAAESVAVLGAWIGALEAIGTRGLQVRVAGRIVHGDGAGGDAWPAGADAAPWRLQWIPADAAAPSPPQAAGEAGTGARRAGPAPVALSDPLPWPEPAASLARWLVQHLDALPRLADAGAALGLPLRTLQRRLAEAGLSYRELLGEVRVRAAAAWLARADAPALAEVGFLCGFADQAHFTREFSRRAGLPPARYRAAAVPGR